MTPLVDIYLSQAYRYLEDENYDGALEYFAKAIEIGSTDYSGLAKAYYYRGMEGFKWSDRNKAISDYTEAIKYDPTNAEYYYARGDVYYEWADYYNSGGLVLEETGSFNKAIADYTKAIQLGMKTAGAFLKRGNCYAGIKNYASAIADYNKVIGLGGDLLDFGYFNRGSAYEETGNKNKALADYRMVLELTTNSFLKEQSLEYIKRLQ